MLKRSSKYARKTRIKWESQRDSGSSEHERIMNNELQTMDEISTNKNSISSKKKTEEKSNI